MKPTNNEKKWSEMIMGLAGLELATLKKWAEEIAGQWNGDNPGLAEDRAHCATDIIEKIKELELLLGEMQELL